MSELHFQERIAKGASFWNCSTRRSSPSQASGSGNQKTMNPKRRANVEPRSLLEFLKRAWMVNLREVIVLLRSWTFWVQLAKKGATLLRLAQSQQGRRQALSHLSFLQTRFSRCRINLARPSHGKNESHDCLRRSHFPV
jgi:hypothetical protein